MVAESNLTLGAFIALSALLISIVLAVVALMTRIGDIGERLARLEERMRIRKRKDR